MLIPTHARSALLERTLDSLSACALPPNRAVRFVVIENGGRHGVDALLKGRSCGVPMEYRYHEQGNKSAALNAFVPEFADALLLFLDDDVRLGPDLLLRYSDAAGAATGGAFFGGGLLIDYEEPPAPWLLKYLPPSARGWHPKEYSPLGRMSFFGCNWAAFARDILDCGGFDADFGPGARSGATGQETAMQDQLRAHGHEPRYIHDAVVWHYVPKSRSSPEWTLERARKMAVASAQWASEDKFRHQFLGIPRWLFRDIARSTAILIVTRLSLDPEKRFRARFLMNQSLGAAAGFKRRLMSVGGRVKPPMK